MWEQNVWVGLKSLISLVTGAHWHVKNYSDIYNSSETEKIFKEILKMLRKRWKSRKNYLRANVLGVRTSSRNSI